VRAAGAAANGAVLVHPGAKDAARRWPVERWADVAARIGRTHRVVVTAGPGELSLAQPVAEAAGRGATVLADGDVADLAAAVAASRLVVSGDTGVAHLATAVRTASVTLFGPTSPALWGPPAWDRGAPHTALWAGRIGDAHGAEPFDGLLEITVHQVVEAVEDVLSREPRGDARPSFGSAATG
jgi:ADP-heptose:LPS heptosyltransferase